MWNDVPLSIVQAAFVTVGASLLTIMPAGVTAGFASAVPSGAFTEPTSALIVPATVPGLSIATGNVVSLPPMGTLIDKPSALAVLVLLNKAICWLSGYVAGTETVDAKESLTKAVTANGYG